MTTYMTHKTDTPLLLKKVKIPRGIATIELPYDPFFLHVGIYPPDTEPHLWLLHTQKSWRADQSEEYIICTVREGDMISEKYHMNRFLGSFPEKNPDGSVTVWSTFLLYKNQELWTE